MGTLCPRADDEHCWPFEPHGNHVRARQHGVEDGRESAHPPVYFTTSFGAGLAPDFAQNCHHGASPLAFGFMKRLFG